MSAIELPSLLSLALRLQLGDARRLTTPCGEGELVWCVFRAIADTVPR
jgi:hypothetical protein